MRTTSETGKKRREASRRFYNKLAGEFLQDYLVWLAFLPPKGYNRKIGKISLRQAEKAKWTGKESGVDYAGNQD